MNIFYPSVRFAIHPKTEYEKLPFELGHYQVIHDGYFDGEKIFTDQHSPIVKCIQYTTNYTIKDDLKVFPKKELEKLLKEGYLHIKKSGEDNC